jgi:hypothetical protein
MDQSFEVVQDSAVVADLAMQCPLLGGTAVYKARSLYSHYVPLLTYSDQDLCGGLPRSSISSSNNTAIHNINQNNGPAGGIKPHTESMLSSRFQLYPNPVSNTLNIEYPSAGVLEITDITNRKLKTIILSNAKGGRATVNLGELPAGMCICRYIVDGKLEEVLKITLLHD